MIRLIITADDNLYAQLASRTQNEGDVPKRAKNVLDGFKQATTQSAGMIIVDMSLLTADTLLETLHSREETASIPLMAITADGQLPLGLRRLCAAVLEVDSL